MKLAAALFFSILNCGCNSPSYPVPPQHEPAPGPDPITAAEYFRAADPDAENYIVEGVRQLEAGAYRWTSENPQFRFQLEDIKDRRFRMEFGVHPVTLRDVGPLEFTVEVNGHVLDHAVFKDAGNATFERPVLMDWLVAGGENRVSIRVHNPWHAADQRVDLGFVFQAAGFVE